MGGRFLTLSLFVVLLSFFIVLNSISSFEDRKAQVVADSVAQAFLRRTATVDQSSPDQSARADSALSKGSTLDQIEALFTEQIAGVESVQNRLGTVMQMNMSVQKFERLLSNAAAPQIGSLSSQSLFIQTLVTLMDTQDSVPYRMDVILRMPDDPARRYHAAPESMRAALRRVSDYADQIESFGLPAKLITAGVASGGAESIHIIFRRYEPLNILAKTEFKKQPAAAPLPVGEE